MGDTKTTPTSHANVGPVWKTHYKSNLEVYTKPVWVPHWHTQCQPTLWVALIKPMWSHFRKQKA